jgi:putative hydrolase of the HAD superfamily
MSEWNERSSGVEAVLFDLGDTLVSYYRRTEFAPVLQRAIAAAAAAVDLHRKRNGTHGRPIDVTAATTAARRFDTERSDSRVWPLAERLNQIFEIGDEEATPELNAALAERFLEPIFDVARVDQSALSVLSRIRELGKKTAIVSNTPWGSPAGPWRRELARHGLLELVDAAVFCVDVGWRKPAREIFAHALRALDVAPSAALFVGDDPQWDVLGARRAGIAPVLLSTMNSSAECSTITKLEELLSVVGEGPRH